MNHNQCKRHRLETCLSVLLAIVLPLWVVAASGTSQAATQTAGILGENNPWATPWYVIEGSEPGPVVVITGGMHGNEPAGSCAAEQIRHWPVRRGRLVVIPQVNRLGLASDMRWFPPLRNDRRLRDLNRNFPSAANDKPRNPVCEALWKFVVRQQPDLVIDLHEGFDFHVSNSKSVGSSIIYSGTPNRDRLARRMQQAVNSAIDDDNRRIVLLSEKGAVTGSLIRACTDQLGIDAFILETTFKDQPVSRRTRQQRTMVSTLLEEIGLIDQSCVNVLEPKRDEKHIRVALFDGPGASRNGVNNLLHVADLADDVTMTHVGPKDIKSGVLRPFDVVLFPGGSGGKQGRAIGKSGRQTVRRYVHDGGGIVGICAGAYLCSADYDWSLHVINTAVYNETVDLPGVGRKSMWYRGGPSKVQLQFTEPGKELLGQTGTVSVRYQNGPIVSKGNETHLPEYTTLAWFRSEVVRYKPQQGTMVDTPALLLADYGKGRVISISPHPEATPGLEQTVVAALRWVSGRSVTLETSPQRQ